MTSEEIKKMLTMPRIDVEFYKNYLKDVAKEEEALAWLKNNYIRIRLFALIGRLLDEAKYYMEENIGRDNIMEIIKKPSLEFQAVRGLMKYLEELQKYISNCPDKYDEYFEKVLK